MLRDHTAIATVSVKDLEAARKYYSEVLGLQLKDDNTQALTYVAGKSVLLVYQSQFAGTNKATGVNWSVGNDFDKTVTELKAKGQEGSLGLEYSRQQDLDSAPKEGDK